MPSQFEILEAGLASRYRLGTEIGRGGMATVYHAEDLAEGKRVAIKVLREQLSAALGPQRFQREIEIARRLDHPSIVPLLSSGELDGVLYFVMPFIEGETLRERVRRETHLTIEEAIRISSEIADGLDYAHRHDVVHRDIKPENVLLARDGHAMIADFGVARVVGAVDQETLSTTGLALGTPTYMSPEQASAKGVVDARSDLYSLGCVLYEMLAGEPPFTGPTPQAIAARHLVEQPRSLRVIRPGVPLTLQTAIEKALSKVPADRHQSAAAFKQNIEGHASLATAPVPAVHPLRRIRWLAAAGVVIAAGLAMQSALRSTPALAEAKYYVGAFTAGTTDSVTPVGRLVAEALDQWGGVELANRSAGDPAERDPANLEALISRARKSGAGHLIVGRVSHRGDSSIVTAMLYAVGDRRLIRQAAVPLPAPIGSAGPLLDSLLVPPEARAPPLAPLGSRVVPALEAFARGRRATSRWALEAADSEFTLATRADPGYARAHLWLAVVRLWRGEPTSAWRDVVSRAMMDSARLGPGDLLKLRALEAHSADNLGIACPRWRSARGLETTDFASWYSLARCLERDRAVVRDVRSPSGWRFRSSYHEAIQAHLTAFRLLPAIYASLSNSAFRPLRELLLTAHTDYRMGEALLPDSGSFVGSPVLFGDTIAVVPHPISSSDAGATRPVASHSAIQRQRRLFREVAIAWASADPASMNAKLAVAIALEMTQDPGALDAIDRARTSARTPADSLRSGTAAVWMRIRAGVPNDPPGVLAARRLADSLIARFEADRSADATSILSLLLLTGRVFQAAGLARSGPAIEMMQVPAPLAREALPLLIYAAAGGPHDSIRALGDRVERSIASLAASSSADEMTGLRMELLGRPATLAFPGVVLPAIRELVHRGDFVLDAQALIAGGDTAGALAGLQAILARNSIPPSERPLDAALPESRIMMIAGAKAAARAWLNPVLDALPIAPAQIFSDPARAASLVPALRYAAALTGSDDNGQSRRLKEIARILWENGDPHLRAER